MTRDARLWSHVVEGWELAWYLREWIGVVEVEMGWRPLGLKGTEHRTRCLSHVATARTPL